MRAAPAMLGWAKKAISGLSRTSVEKFENPMIIGATMHGIDAGTTRRSDLRPHGIEVARQARHVTRRMRIRAVRGAQGGRDGLHAGRKRRIGLVGEAVIVLDVVDAAVPQNGAPDPRAFRPTGPAA